jgi:hypothetical protein
MIDLFGRLKAIYDRIGAPAGASVSADVAAVKTVVDGLAALLPTKTLSTANDTVAAGYYEATTLHAVDADLATGNIKSGVTIFGIEGTSTVKDVSDTTAVAADVAIGKYFYTADGTKTEGTCE